MPLARFFEDYKKNENKEVKVDEFLGAEVARKTVLDSMVSAFPTVSVVSIQRSPQTSQSGTPITTCLLARHN